MVVSGTAASVRRRARDRTRLLALALVLATTGLVGCQSNPVPPPLDAASASPSPTSSPSESAPTMPAAAKGTTEAAAKAFVRHYVASVNFAMRTGDTRGLSGLAAVGCATCGAIVNRIDEVYGSGGHLQGDGWKVVTLTYIKPGGRDTALVAAGIEIAPQTAHLSSTDAPSHSPSSRGNLDFFLRNAASGWRVHRLEATQ